MADREEIAKLRRQLEMKQTIINKQTMDIESVKGICIYYFEHSEEISIIYDKVLWPSN